MIVLDSDAIIDHLRGDADVETGIRHAIETGETLATTTVNIAEILRGLHPAKQARRRATFNALLETIDVLPLDTHAAQRYGQLLATLDASGDPIPAMDGLIAAIALETGARLWTRNQRHFDRIPGLETTTP